MVRYQSRRRPMTVVLELKSIIGGILLVLVVTVVDDAMNWKLMVMVGVLFRLSLSLDEINVRMTTVKVKS